MTEDDGFAGHITAPADQRREDVRSTAASPGSAASLAGHPTGGRRCGRLVSRRGPAKRTRLVIHQVRDLVLDGPSRVPGRHVPLAGGQAEPRSITPVTSSPNSSVTAQAVTYTATISPVPDGGTVAFSDGRAPIPGRGTQQEDTSTGTATCPVTYTSTGTRVITATYSGDTAFTASTGLLTQTHPASNRPLQGIRRSKVRL